MNEISPEILYARSGDIHIAYATVGEGDADIVVAPGAVSSVDLTVPSDLVTELARVGRTTVFDKRGTGLSDREARFTPEERMDDLRAVMDAAGIEHAHLVGISEGGPLAVLFAAAYPRRTDSLTLYGTFPSWRRQADYAGGRSMTMAQFGHFLDQIDRAYAGDMETLRWYWEMFSPTLARDDRFLAAALRWMRRTASPGAARIIFELLYDIDVRHVLPTVQAPTTVVHVVGDRVAPIEGGRYFAAHIPGAVIVELPGEDHSPPPGSPVPGAIAGAVARHIAAAGSRADAAGERWLASLLFTDIVGSTEAAARMGDARWRSKLDEHDRAARASVARWHGRLVKLTGDGFLATFDVPGRALSAAVDFQRLAREAGLAVRAGVHCGEIEERAGDVAGIAVHVAARIAALAGADELLATSTVKDLTVGSDFQFHDRGLHALKGVPEEWRVYEVRS